jgi:hypothetical protein
MPDLVWMPHLKRKKPGGIRGFVVVESGEIWGYRLLRRVNGAFRGYFWALWGVGIVF